MFGYKVLGFGSGGGGPTLMEVDYLNIAGGGRGGDTQAAGGGAGGFRTSYPGGTKLEMYTGTPYSITIGAGGTNPGTSTGGVSTTALESTITSSGGGAGNGQPGGSGAGGGPNPQAGGSGNAGGYTPAEGTNGGTNSTGYGPGSAGMGGGGASQAGQPGGPGARIGGDGSANSITDSAVTYAGGGGGGDHPGEGGGSAGGSGGGGSGGGTSQAGTDGLGGGGGGGGNGPPEGASGGNGKVFIRIPAAYGVSAPAVTIAPGTNTATSLSPSGDVLLTFAVTGTVEV